MTPFPIRVYADTSVYGGVFDEDYDRSSRAFFSVVRSGRFRLVFSTVVADEIAEAPANVREFFNDLRSSGEMADVSEEALRLQAAYLASGVVTPKWGADALHVALATVSGCRIIVSWNFKHIVNFRKIPMYNGVNFANGHGPIAIHTPREVIDDEDQDV